MSIPGLHLTQIGNGDYLLDPSKSLDIGDSDRLIERVVAQLMQSHAVRLYYDLSDMGLIEPRYYSWLDRLARAMHVINVEMICIHMQPTAAFALARVLDSPPFFRTALEIQDWQS